jgi:hypothetical protein
MAYRVSTVSMVGLGSEKSSRRGVKVSIRRPASRQRQPCTALEGMTKLSPGADLEASPADLEAEPAAST